MMAREQRAERTPPRGEVPIVEPVVGVEIVADEVLDFREADGFYEIVLGRTRRALGEVPAERQVVARLLVAKRAFAGVMTRPERAAEILDGLTGAAGRA